MGEKVETRIAEADPGTNRSYSTLVNAECHFSIEIRVKDRF